ncbi:hypothetical protein CPB85DRAFT_1315072 [Mucidula mucida]|nr:hypothetical protein CPB85DRAFT_1315072 [Mucidula mucida]
MMAQYSDERPPPLVDQRAPMGMAGPGMIQPPAGAAHAGNEGFFGAFPGHSSNNAYVGATPVQWGGAPMSPFDTLNNFPSPGPNPNPNPYAERSGSPDPWGIGGGPWQDLSANQWPRSPPPNQDGFHSTAWPGGNGASPSMTGQPIGDGFFGSRAGTTSPYSNTTSPRPYTHNLDNNAFASYNYSGGPASAPLPSPPLHEKPRRSFSIGRRKARDDGWYPRDTNNYGEANLAQRPRDWSQDFELHPSMLKRVAAPKNRSDVKESPDPIKRALHPLLQYSLTRPPINLDIRYNPLQGTETTLFPYLGRAFNHIDLYQLATTPSAPFMRLYHPRYPWYIDVRPSQPNGVTVYDIVMALHQHFTAPILNRHYWCEDVTSRDREEINRAYYLRCRSAQEELSKGVRRCDFLGMHKMLRLQGLTRGRMGMWEMKIAVVDL